MRCLVTGVTGQDGSIIAEQLIDQGHEVHGVVRRRSNPRLDNIEHLDKLKLHTADICDQTSLDRVFAEVQPDEAYALAAQSFVGASFTQPAYTVQATALGILHVLESVRRISPHTRLYVAGSSEQFGATPPPHNEQSRFHPRSPYGCAKVMAHDMARVYREAYNLFVVVGILGNHESIRRGVEFLTRKVAIGVAEIAHGRKSHLELGNLDAKRDWGWANDYTRAMQLMLRVNEPKDYVVGTGECYTVREFVEYALQAVELQPDIERYVKVNPLFVRPAEVDVLRLDSSLIRKELGWVPTVTFRDLVTTMVQHEWLRIQNEEAAISAGY